MKLQAYLLDAHQSPASFAESLGVPASTVTRWLSGQRRPSLELVVRVRDATGGLVTIDDFLDIPSTLPVVDAQGAPAAEASASASAALSVSERAA